MNHVIINPYNHVKKKQHLHHSFPLTDMPRLRSELVKQGGYDDIKVSFKLSSNENSVRISIGTSCTLPLICQRCMQSVEYVFQIDHDILLLRTESQARDCEDDAVFLQDEELSLLTLAEDELILNLPLIAKHDDSTHCYKQYTGNLETVDDDIRYKPFANLRKLHGKMLD